MLLTEFYANREVFITGATGYLGKALIEKLLRDCPKLKVIYVLLRDKKSVNVEQRLEDLKKDKVFERIHKECPEVLNKLCAIQGDSIELGLGIKPQDLELLKNVSIIFHNAANVRFDDDLRSSILLNSRGTHELLKIAENLKNLVAFIHCSTAYCNPFNDVVEEKVYDMPVNWQRTIKIAETYDVYTLNALFPKYSGFYPNTYTFTKNISEQIVKDYSDRLPVVIFRPSIVTNAFKEPIPGWTDNMNGVMAILIGVSIGILPVLYCFDDVALDCVPVDMVTKLTINAAYRRGLQVIRKEPLPNNPVVINCATNEYFRLSIKGCLDLYMKSILKNPMENFIWYCNPPWTTSSYYQFLLNIFTVNIPVSLLLDTILRLMGRKPLMLKITRRIIYNTKATSFYCFWNYKLINNNIVEIDDSLDESEVDKFGFIKDAFENFDYASYFDDNVRGVKYYLFNQKPQASEALCKRYKITMITIQAIEVILLAVFLRYLWLYLAS